MEGKRYYQEKVLLILIYNFNNYIYLIGLGKNEQGILYPIIVIKGPNDKGIVINKNENTDF